MSLKLDKLIAFTRSTRFLLLGYIIVTVIASIYPFFLPDKDGYKHYNNYVIFRQSFYHLIHHKDLYVLYLGEQWDLFKYSPAFALFMGTIAWMPDVLGGILWNLLNSLVLFFAIKTMPVLPERRKQLMILFVFLEMLTSLQNFQSNALLAGLIVFSFNFFERRNVWMAALCIVLTVYIKLFGIVAFALFLFYPDKIKFMLAAALWMILLTFIPLFVIPWEELIQQYQSWGRMLSEDHAASYGLSVMGWLYTWLGFEGMKNGIVLIGVLAFCMPLVRFSMYKNEIFRLLMLASVLLWMVIFNHKAESPTFVIAITGVAVWYFSQGESKWNTALLFLAFALTSLSPTDIVPSIAKTFIIAYTLKAVPCILIWFKLLYDAMRLPVDASFESTEEYS